MHTLASCIQSNWQGESCQTATQVQPPHRDTGKVSVHSKLSLSKTNEKVRMVLALQEIGQITVCISLHVQVVRVPLSSPSSVTHTHCSSRVLENSLLVQTKELGQVQILYTTEYTGTLPQSLLPPPPSHPPSHTLPPQQLSQQRRVLERSASFPDGGNSETSRLRQVLLERQNELDQAQERVEKLQGEVER